MQTDTGFLWNRFCPAVKQDGILVFGLLFCRAEKIRISKTLDNHFVVSAGKRSVEVTPETFAVFFTVIGMRPVAVNQNTVTGNGSRGTLIKIESQAAVSDVHEKKTVVGVPLEGISLFIKKAPDIEWIKEHFLCGEAWRINIII